MRIVFTILVAILSVSTSSAQWGRKFRPVYGNDAEINRTLAFVTENLVLDSLTYTRLGSLNGYVRCAFSVDEEGKISEVKILKGLARWIDYELQMAMVSLPAMQPFYNKNGEKVKVRRDIYFTFSDGEENKWQSPYTMPDQLSQSIDEQRKEYYDKIAKADKEWNEFTKDNSKISLDGKGVYKPGILPQNPLKVTPPPTRPPITVTIKSE